VPVVRWLDNKMVTVFLIGWKIKKPSVLEGFFQNERFSGTKSASFFSK